MPHARFGSVLNLSWNPRLAFLVAPLSLTFISFPNIFHPLLIPPLISARGSYWACQEHGFAVLHWACEQAGRWKRCLKSPCGTEFPGTVNCLFFCRQIVRDGARQKQELKVWPDTAPRPWKVLQAAWSGPLQRYSCPLPRVSLVLRAGWMGCLLLATLLICPFPEPRHPGFQPGNASFYLLEDEAGVFSCSLLCPSA